METSDRLVRSRMRLLRRKRLELLKSTTWHIKVGFTEVHEIDGSLVVALFKTGIGLVHQQVMDQ
jgi:hypothetical protein